MTDIATLTQMRMGLVERLATLNAKHLLNTQTRSGVEVELLACIEEIERDGEHEAAVVRRAELMSRHKEAVDACAECEREIDALADELSLLDKHIDRVAGSAP